MSLKGRVIKKGRARGKALVSPEPIGFLGGVDPKTATVMERGHPLEGECIAGKVLVFPSGKGSTVGSYVLYRLAKEGKAPLALICSQADPVVAVGAIMAEIPMVDQVDIARIRTGDEVTVEGETVWVEGDELVFLKLGGSLITDKAREATPRKRVIRRLAREVKRALQARPDLKLVLGHGSGSFGHFVAHRYGVHLGLGEGDWLGYAETAAAAARLNRLVNDIFLEEGVPVLSIQPSASALCREGELIYLETRPVIKALERDLVPLVYGDVALDLARGSAIASTEHLFAYLARRLRPRRIVLAGVVEGVFSADPLQDREARLLPEITPANWGEAERALSGAMGVDVTGGMLSKVRMMYELVRELPELEVWFVSGARAGVVEQALMGLMKRGTRLHR